MTRDHASAPLAMHPGAWSDEQPPRPEDRVAFRRMVEVEPGETVGFGRGPSPAVWVGIAVIAALVVAAYLAFRLAPP